MNEETHFHCDRCGELNNLEDAIRSFVGDKKYCRCCAKRILSNILDGLEDE